MGKVVFGSCVFDKDLSVEENLGPFIASVHSATIDTLFDINHKFKEFRENEDIWLINTKITPIPGTGMILVTGDKVRVYKCPI